MERLGSHEIGAELAAELAELLSRGGIVAYPTETYYGLGVSPWDEAGLARLSELKGERGSKPLPLVLASSAAVLRVAAFLPPGFAELSERFWPGPLTLVLPARLDLPGALTAGSGTIGVRVPAHALARSLARVAGGALTSTSANRSGAPPPRTAEQVLESLGGRLDRVLDGGPTPGGLASTVLDLTSRPPRLLRRGPVAASDIAGLVGGPLEGGGRPG